MDTERNLLLALQAGFIDQDQFVQVCTLWTTRQHVPLADLLVQHGWLTPVDRSNLDLLLQRQLHRHGGSPQASLAAVVSPELQEVLTALHDPEVERSLTGLPAASVTATGLAATAGRNVLLGEIGRGGMGAVFKGRDTELGRELAVKVLLDEHRDHPELVRRFLEEAQIAGQLQHPGVAPVYELGRFADDRPFFTMKLVKGQTLAELLRQRDEARADLGKFLGIFAHVCQTMAYAHAHGVIHRDLKPANVMVGNFGEVQVMDWGLAKVLRPDRPQREPDAPGDVATVIQTSRSTAMAENDSRTGVVGTPGYMAPEQARAETDAVDERADVFGLGAILCAVLTGQPPLPGSRTVALAASRQGDLEEAFARLDGCGADADLMALCRECLAPVREERPRHAGVLAERVAAYQAAVQERLRRAELERAQAEVKAREERKRRRVQLILAATVVALFLTGGAAWVWVERVRSAQKAEAAQAAQQRERKVHAQVHEARVLHERAGKAGPAERRGLAAAALAAAERADALLVRGEADPQLRAQVAAFLTRLRDEDKQRQADDRDRLMLERLAQARLSQTAVLDNVFRNDKGEKEYRQAFLEYGIDFQKLSPAEAARRLRDRPIRKQLVAALDDWIMIRRLVSHPDDPRAWEPLFKVARLADPDRWRNRVRNAMVSRKWNPRLLLKLAKTADLAVQPPESLYNLYMVLMWVDAQEAHAFLVKAQRHHPSGFGLTSTLGLAFRSGLGTPPRPDEALRFTAAALALAPRSPGAHYNLGIVLADLRRDEEAIAAFEDAIRLDPRYVEAHDGRGAALARLGEHDRALEAHRKALKIRPSATTLSNISFVLGKQGKWLEAEKTNRAAIKLEPYNPPVYFNLATSLFQQERLAEAVEAYKTTLNMVEQALDAPLLERALRRGLWRSGAEYPTLYKRVYSALGALLYKLGQLDAALRVLDRGLARYPNNAEGHYTRGHVLAAQNKLDAAASAFRIVTRLRPTYAPAYRNLGTVLGRQKRPDEAAAAFRKASELEPTEASAYYNLGIALREQKRPNEAVDAFRKAIALQPNHPDAYLYLGIIHSEQKKPAEAEAAFRKAIELRPRLAETWANLGSVLLEQLSGTTRRLRTARPSSCAPTTQRPTGASVRP
jgi:serine/threonine-protein kinase